MNTSYVMFWGKKKNNNTSERSEIAGEEVGVLTCERRRSNADDSQPTAAKPLASVPFSTLNSRGVWVMFVTGIGGLEMRMQMLAEAAFCSKCFVIYLFVFSNKNVFISFHWLSISINICIKIIHTLWEMLKENTSAPKLACNRVFIINKSLSNYSFNIFL